MTSTLAYTIMEQCFGFSFPSLLAIHSQRDKDTIKNSFAFKHKH